MQAIYALVVLGALCRVLAPVAPAAYAPLLQTAALLWAGAFLAFLVVYGPLLARPRSGSESV